MLDMQLLISVILDLMLHKERNIPLGKMVKFFSSEGGVLGSNPGCVRKVMLRKNVAKSLSRW